MGGEGKKAVTKAEILKKQQADEDFKRKFGDMGGDVIELLKAEEVIKERKAKAGADQTHLEQLNHNQQY